MQENQITFVPNDTVDKTKIPGPQVNLFLQIPGNNVNSNIFNPENSPGSDYSPS